MHSETIRLIRDSKDDGVKNEDFSTKFEKKEFSYEGGLSLIGFGKFHIILILIGGLANASDAIEILCVSFILPAAECDLKMTTSDKGFLSSMTFAGMLIGGYIWGSISDVYGRKFVLSGALIFNAFFGILCGLSQRYLLLLLFRFLSGIGVGGSVPIIWSYVSEFSHKNIRGRMLCLLASAWVFGNLLVILFAYCILNNPNIHFKILNGFIFVNDWRLFMIVCSVPSILTGIFLLFMPESPKFCFYNGNELKAKKIMKMVYSFNNKSKTAHCLEKKKVAFEFFEKIRISDELNSNENLDKEIIYRSNLNGLARISFFFRLFTKSSLEAIKKSIDLFKPPHTSIIIMTMFIWFALCFGYYGLWMWLPELYKRMDLYGGSPCNLKVSTNKTINSHNSSTCIIENQVFVASFYSALSNIPGNIFTVIFIDKMGRNLITSLSLIGSGLCVLGIPFIHSSYQGVILTTIFGGINVLTFNSYGCTTTELFPTKLRSTSIGVQYMAGRTGAILGNIIFGLAVDVSCYIPLFSIALLMVVSGLVALKLPESNKIEIN